MTHRIGVIMDPIASINPKKDSTLAMMIAMQKREWELYYIEQDGLFLQNEELVLNMTRIQVRDDLSDWFSMGEACTLPARELDMILLRKDPPFDMEYVYTTYLLEHAEARGVLVVNKPGSVRDCNEKLFATRFPQCGPPLTVSRDIGVLKRFHAEQGDVIFKPLDGMGGSSVFRAGPGDPNLNVILETLTGFGAHQIMGQRYIPEIRAGDTRILLINGEPVPYGLARIPASGETRGNLAAGGSGVGRELTPRDLWICEQVGPVLREKGLVFVGIDVIGDYLTEINVTCPTCIRELDRAFDLDIAGQLMDHLESRLAAR